MYQNLEEVLAGRFSKERMVGYLSSNPEAFDEAVKLSLDRKKLVSWRAAWVLNHCITDNDSRITPYISDYIQGFENREDGHQREFLKILERMEVNEDQEGYLFDLAVTFWEDISKQPSVRIVAFRILAKIASKYPEMYSEIALLIQDQYVDTLSPGIKNSLNKQWAKIQKNQK